MDPDFSSSVSRVWKLIDDVRRTAVEIAVNRADFLMMAYYLVELRPFLEQLNKQQEFLSVKFPLPSLQHLTNVIESMHTFTKVCASRSRIHLLFHSVDLAQNMNKSIKELAECLSGVFDEIREVSSSCENKACEVHTRLESLSFQPDPGHNRLAQEIRTSLASTARDYSMDVDEQQMQCTAPLQKIATHLNVDFSEVSLLQLELQKDLTQAESEGREDDIHELKKLCVLLCSPEVADDRRALFISEPPSPGRGHVWEKQSSRSVRKANTNAAPKAGPKLHLVIAEYVRLIQCKRRAARDASLKNVATANLNKDTDNAAGSGMQQEQVSTMPPSA